MNLIEEKQKLQNQMAETLTQMDKLAVEAKEIKTKIKKIDRLIAQSDEIINGHKEG